MALPLRSNSDCFRRPQVRTPLSLNKAKVQTKVLIAKFLLERLQQLYPPALFIDGSNSAGAQPVVRKEVVHQI